MFVTLLLTRADVTGDLQYLLNRKAKDKINFCDALQDGDFAIPGNENHEVDLSQKLWQPIKRFLVCINWIAQG